MFYVLINLFINKVQYFSSIGNYWIFVGRYKPFTGYYKYCLLEILILSSLHNCPLNP